MNCIGDVGGFCGTGHAFEINVKEKTIFQKIQNNIVL